MHFAFSQNHEFLVQTVLGKFRDFVESRRLLREGRASEHIPALLETHLNKLDNLPRPIAWLAKRFARQANVVGAARTVAQRQGAEQMNLAQFLSATADELGSTVGANAFQPSLTWLWIVLSLNFSVFAFLKFYF